MQIDPMIFRAYDIRGIAYKTLTKEAVFNIGCAIGTTILRKGGDKVIIGRDGRLSGRDLKDELVLGLCTTGCDVIDIGLVPTPCLYFASVALDISSAIMLTGSHNPKEYNGLKIIIDNTTLYGEQIQHLRTLIENQDFLHGFGNYTTDNIITRYIETITQKLKPKKQFKVVIDCGNGVAGAVAPKLYEALGAQVITLHCDVDGNFPNHHPDPSDPANLKDLIQAVKSNHADLGLAFDGDGDRLGVVDNNGKIIWPDRLLMLFVEELLASNPGSTIIYDVKCTRDLPLKIKELGGIGLMYNTGHSLIKAKMKETGSMLAAEMSGHIFFKDNWYGFDDALYAGARLINLLSTKELSLSDLCAILPELLSTPELAIEVMEDEKFDIIKQLKALAAFDNSLDIITIDGIRVEYKDGWGLIRASNTSAKLVARFEAINEQVLKMIKDQFCKAMTTVAPHLQISSLL